VHASKYHVPQLAMSDVDLVRTLKGVFGLIASNETRAGGMADLFCLMHHFPSKTSHALKVLSCWLCFVDRFIYLYLYFILLSIFVLFVLFCFVFDFYCLLCFICFVLSICFVLFFLLSLS
jgi:hypothetical protein